MRGKCASLNKAMPYMVVILCTLAVWVFFQFKYEYTFFYKEQNQLFLLSSDYLATYFDKPAWLGNMVGDYLTQFYYYLYAGAAIFSGLLLLTCVLIMWALKRIGLPRWLSCLVALIVGSILAIFNFDPDYRMANVVCVLGTALMLLLWTLFIRKGYWAKINAAIVFGYLGWWMFALGTNSIGKFSTPYYQLEDYLEVDNLFYFGRYDELAKKVETMKREDVTGIISCYYYMSKAEKGLLPQYIGRVSPVNLGTLYHIGPKSTLQEMKIMNELYFLLGDITMTERAAMLGLVSSPNNRNVRMIKRLAEANLVAGDDEAAMKYIRILENTFAYKKWAKANRPGHFNAQLMKKRTLMNKDDRLRTDDNCREILIGLLEANPRNVAALHYLMCTDIQVGQKELFYSDYEKYYLPIYGKASEPLYKQCLVGYESSKE